MNHAEIPSSQLNWDWRLLATAALILLSILGVSVLSHGSPVVLRKALREFPQTMGVWRAGPDEPIDAETQKILGATDLLNRSYSDEMNRQGVGLFVAFFSSQRKGGAIHSPKNCLPGSGWEPVKGAIIPVTIPSPGKTVEINEYVIQNGLKREVVLYWYQSQGRVIASEYTAKFCLIWDAIRKNRTDGALVRIVSPVVNGDEDHALELAKSFVQESFPHLAESLPN